MPRHGDSIRLVGTSHSIPRCFVNLFDDLRDLDGVEIVGQGTWTRKGYSEKFELNIQYFDETTRTFRLKAHYQEYAQNYFVRVNSEEDSRNAVRNYVAGYNG